MAYKDKQKDPLLYNDNYNPNGAIVGRNYNLSYGANSVIQPVALNGTATPATPQTTPSGTPTYAQYKNAYQQMALDAAPGYAKQDEANAVIVGEINEPKTTQNPTQGATPDPLYKDIEAARQNTYNQAETARERLVADASTSYAKNKATYGANAEALRAMGLSGSGYSDYLNSQAYAAYRDEAQKANAAYETAKAQADVAAESATAVRKQEAYDKYLEYKDAITYNPYSLSVEDIDRAVEANTLSTTDAEALKTLITDERREVFAGSINNGKTSEAIAAADQLLEAGQMPVEEYQTVYYDAMVKDIELGEIAGIKVKAKNYGKIVEAISELEKGGKITSDKAKELANYAREKLGIKATVVNNVEINKDSINPYVINGKSYMTVEPDDTNPQLLNAISTGSANTAPAPDTVVEYNGKYYVYKTLTNKVGSKASSNVWLPLEDNTAAEKATNWISNKIKKIIG